MTAQPASRPLRLLLAILLAASSLRTGPLAARRERGDVKASCIAARAAILRPPAGGGVPDLPPFPPALSCAGPSLSAKLVVSAGDLPPAGGLVPARPGHRAPSARAPPLPA